METVASNVRPTLRRYLERVAVAVEGGSFADELLCAALKTVLSAPPSLLPRNAVIPALKTALKAGAAHIPTAEAALAALEQWIAMDKRQGESVGHSLRDFLPEILPLLDAYLFDGSQVALTAEAAAKESDAGAARSGSKHS